jgi:hypothetical protein
MLKTILALGALMVFVPSADASERRDYSCSAVPDRKGGVREVCNIGFFNLWRSPEAFDGKYIRISGFVVDLDGRQYIHASKDMYDYSGGRGGIALSGSEEGLREVRLLADQGKPVSISGHFLWGTRGTWLESLGTMDVISGMSWVQTPPDQPPQL